MHTRILQFRSVIRSLLWLVDYKTPAELGISPTLLTEHVNILSPSLPSIPHQMFCGIATPRLLSIVRHLSTSSSVREQYMGMASKMASSAKLDIHSKYKMNSGHEIPVLGYGVSVWPRSSCLCLLIHVASPFLSTLILICAIIHTGRPMEIDTFYSWVGMFRARKLTVTMLCDT